MIFNWLSSSHVKGKADNFKRPMDDFDFAISRKELKIAMINMVRKTEGMLETYSPEILKFVK